MTGQALSRYDKRLSRMGCVPLQRRELAIEPFEPQLSLIPMMEMPGLGRGVRQTACQMPYESAALVRAPSRSAYLSPSAAPSPTGDVALVSA
jgi:hypothetical protein